MKNEEQQKAPENEKDLAKEIQEKAFKGGQNELTTYKSNLQAPEAPKVELPKGGGALRSIGEKFEANPVTGTANISVPVAISPGRNGFQPDLSLSYGSGGGNGIFGIGWGVGLGSIIRKTQKGLPLYDDANESDVYVFAGVEDLVPVPESEGGKYNNAEETHSIQRYQPRIEGSFFKIERWTKLDNGNLIPDDIHWRVTDKANIVSVLGESPEARIYDSVNASRISEWKIERKYDTLGNCIQFEYFRENANNIASTAAEHNRLANATSYNQLYPRSIKYGNSEMYGGANWANNTWYFEVIFNYGEDDAYPVGVDQTNINWPQRPDAFSSFRTGFDIRTYRLCHKILMYHHFEGLNDDEPLLVKSTEITYDENKVGCQIQSVSHKGYDETEEKAFPPVSFVYSKAEPNPKIYTLKNSDLKNLPQGIDGQNFSFADPKGEGINGILTESANAWYFKPNLGHDNFYEDHPANYIPEPIGSFGSLETLQQKPLGASPASLQDIDGDGKPEAVIREPHMAGFYKQKENGEWGAFQYFDGYPNLNFQSEDIKFIDLNGDGRADILISKQDTLEWIAYEDNDVFLPAAAQKVKPGYGKMNVISRALDEEQGPRVVFSNGKQNIFLSDMTGDGFSDLVRIENGSISYWPNKGFGQFGAKVMLDNVPTFDYVDQFDASRIRLGDIDGSGTSDILYLGSKETAYFINEAGNSLANGVVLQNFPSKDQLQNVQLADILGNGTSCLVWSSSHEKDQPLHVKYMDLMGGEKPYLLKEMDNNMGALRKFSYAPSTKFYLRDKMAGTPWVTKLSFPVQTLERVEVFEQITQSRFVSRYAYHHGYFDPVEKEFRGFGMVEQWDTELYEDFSEPALYQVGSNALEEESHSEPIYTKTWFHNGYYQQKQKIENHFATEYWSEDDNAFSIAAHELPTGLKADELREAYRALKGSALRQEVYGLNPQGEKGIPYSVTESRYKVFQIRARGNNRFGNFRTELQESFSYSYERDKDDPRISQQLLLESDAYGNPLKSVVIAYPRRGTGHDAEQLKAALVYRDNTFININPSPVSGILADTAYRIGAGSTESVWEYRPQNFAAPVQVSGLLDVILSAEEISVEDDFTGLENEKRLISKSKINYYDQTLTSALAQGEIAFHGLPYQTQQLVFTNELINAVYNEGGTTRLDSTSSAGQTLLSEAGYVQEGSNWWKPSGRLVFDDTSFYLPTSSLDVFGNTSSIEYDEFNLFPVQITDALGNEVLAENNYVHLQPSLMTDPNGNRQQVILDALGMPIKALIMGKSVSHPAYTGDEGDSLEKPSQTFEYDLFQFKNHQLPCYSKVIQRETHVHSSDSNDETVTSVSFFNGLGKTIQARAQFGEYEGDNNEETKVVVSGQQVVNNKDLVIEQYEPYFDTGFNYRMRFSNQLKIPAQELGLAVENFVQEHGEGSLINEVLLKTELDQALGKNETAVTYYESMESSGIARSEIHFNGTSDIDFGLNNQYELGDGDFTIEAWVKSTYSAAQRSILSNQNHLNDQFSGVNLTLVNGYVQLVVGDASGNGWDGLGTIRTEVQIPQNVWTHVVAVRTGNDALAWKIYFNGEEVSFYAILNNLNGGDINAIEVNSLKIASKRESNADHYFNGSLKNIRFYERAISNQEVQANYSTGVSGSPLITDKLLLWAKLNENSLSNVFADSSSYQEQGSLIGAGTQLDWKWNAQWAENIEQGMTRIKMQYDVLGRNTRVDYEDGSFEKVEFDAWQQKNYDRNDTVQDSQWYIDRNSPDPLAANEPTDSEERAAYLAARHHDTPQTIDLDSLGRVYQTTDHNRSFTWQAEPANLFVVTNSFYTIQSEQNLQGKQLSVTNALGQKTEFAYDLTPMDREGNANVLYTDSPDGGWRRLLLDAVGNPIKSWNERGHTARNEYDELLRPTNTYVDEGTGEQLVSYMVYSESIGQDEDPSLYNLKGQAIRSFDQSGVSRSLSFDFKGNPLETSKSLTAEYKQTIDWKDIASETELSELDAQAEDLYLELDSDDRVVVYSNRMEYDGMNRPTLITQPDGTQHQPIYNKVGLLNQMKVKLNHEDEFTAHVSSILYNAKGQRTDIYYGNNTKTKYEYDTANFRLTRLLTTRNTGADILQDLNYTFDAVGNIVEQNDDAQQTHYFNNSVIEPKGKYEYDSLYRLIKATGREKENLSAPSSAIYVPEALPTNGKSGAVFSNYKEEYTYDELGNILELKHVGTSPGADSWTRTYVYNSGTSNNYLQSAYTGDPAPSSAQFTYDRHGNIEQMTHLSSLKWDFQDQLQATVKNEETTYYVYSGGQRVRKITVDSSGEEEQIKYERIYLGGYELYKEYEDPEESNLERATHHVLDDQKMIALLEVKVKTDGEAIELAEQKTITRYQYGNHLGSACLELNENAEMLSYQEFHPFGSTAYSMHSNDAEVSLKRYQYNGKERDDETGLDYYGARYYASWLCRFISVDPKKDAYAFQNSFAYAANNPVTMIDVNGENPGGGDDPTAVKQDNTSVAPVKVKENSSGSTDVYNVNMFDVSAFDGLEKGDRGIRVGEKGSQFKMVGLYDSSGNAVAWLAQRIVPEGEYEGLYNGTGEGLQDAFIVPLDSFAHFKRNAGSYYNASRTEEIYDVMWGEIDRSPWKSFVMAGGLSAGVGASGLFRGLTSLPRTLRSFPQAARNFSAAARNLINTAGKISNLKKFLSLRSAVQFGEKAKAALFELGSYPSDVSIKNGVARINISFTKSITKENIELVEETLKANGATSVEIMTGAVKPRLKEIFNNINETGKSFQGYKVEKTLNPLHNFKLTKKFK